jgi:hypothetical protein
VTQALVKTFNGENPCRLCLAVQQGMQAEKQPGTMKVEIKLDLFLVDRSPDCLCPGLQDMKPIRPLSVLAFARFERPPSPPPRAA